MYGGHAHPNGVHAPSHFKESARSAIYQQLQQKLGTSGQTQLNNLPNKDNNFHGDISSTHSSAASVRSAPSLAHTSHASQASSNKQSHRSSSSSIFSKRSVRSAPSIYSSSTATIPEDSEPISTTVEQLVNDIALHEKFYHQKFLDRKVQQEPQSFQLLPLQISPQYLLPQSFGMRLVSTPQLPRSGASTPINEEIDEDEYYKISLGSSLQYQNAPESLVDWNLNVTRCKLMLNQLPMILSIPDFSYSQNSLPQLIGDLAQMCQIVLIQPHISDKEFIHILYNSNLYSEHNLDTAFKKSVAEISVKQSRLLQINEPRGSSSNMLTPILAPHNLATLKFKYKEIAIRNYLINLAAAATTAHEYKLKVDDIKRQLKIENRKAKLTKEEKQSIWEVVRLDVFKRAGLEEN